MRITWQLLAPALKTLPPNRRAHAEEVVKCHRALTTRNFHYLYRRLNDNSVSFREYRGWLEKLHTVYRSLSRTDQRILHAAIILHDIGYIKSNCLAHNTQGALIAPTFLKNKFPEHLIPQVQPLIEMHGLMNDVGVNLLPKDLEGLSDTQIKQLLILSSMDTAGKPDKSYLFIRTIKDYLNIFNGKAKNPEWFFKYRIQHVLGGNCYAYISDEATDHSIATLEEMMSAEEFTALKRNITDRFRCNCWPVFKDLVTRENDRLSFLRALRLLVRLQKLFRK